eukprot:jgi/Mesen1/9935/ME000070S09216
MAHVLDLVPLGKLEAGFSVANGLAHAAHVSSSSSDFNCGHKLGLRKAEARGRGFSKLSVRIPPADACPALKVSSEQQLFASSGGSRSSPRTQRPGLIERCTGGSGTSQQSAICLSAANGAVMTSSDTKGGEKEKEKEKHKEKKGKKDEGANREGQAGAEGEKKLARDTVAVGNGSSSSSSAVADARASSPTSPSSPTSRSAKGTTSSSSASSSPPSPSTSTASPPASPGKASGGGGPERIAFDAAEPSAEDLEQWRVDEEKRRELIDLIDQLDRIRKHALDLEHRNAGLAAFDRNMIMKLMDAGMDVARVNCAHDDERIWWVGRVMMDLGGPKLRTGPLESGPKIAKLKPKKDVKGNFLEPARVFLTRPGVRMGAESVGLVVPVNAPEGWVEGVRVGQSVHFLDARGKAREMRVVERVSGKHGEVGLVAECRKGAYIETGARLSLDSLKPGKSGGGGLEGEKEKEKERERREKGKGAGAVAVAGAEDGSGSGSGSKAKAKGGSGSGSGGGAAGAGSGAATWATVGELPAMEYPISLVKDDVLVLTRERILGRNAVVDAVTGRVLEPARVACEVFGHVRVGEPIKLDDGKVEGVIVSADGDEIRMRVTHAPAKGAKLKSEKAINLPDSDLPLKGLTDKDRHDLDYVATHADMVALSFVNDADDVLVAQEELRKRGAEHLGVVLKIETKKGFNNLPWMLLQGMQAENPMGVMIARGDMAVECGWERLAEVQEQVLWLCEAAHVPAIWATQVLEGLAKGGLPSRAEITDAAMGERAECVMLNKGPHIVLAVKTLKDILSRMRSHQTKKSSMLRPLQLSQPFALQSAPSSPSSPMSPSGSRFL